MTGPLCTFTAISISSPTYSVVGCFTQNPLETFPPTVSLYLGTHVSVNALTHWLTCVYLHVETDKEHTRAKDIFRVTSPLPSPVPDPQNWLQETFVRWRYWVTDKWRYAWATRQECHLFTKALTKTQQPNQKGRATLGSHVRDGGPLQEHRRDQRPRWSQSRWPAEWLAEVDYSVVPGWQF